MGKLENDTRDIALTPEFVKKSDMDIATIVALDKFAKETGNILVLTGGYATEAHCGGKITRAHGDIDAHLILTGQKSAGELFFGVRELLSRESTNWILRDQKPDKVVYLYLLHNRKALINHQTSSQLAFAQLFVPLIVRHTIL